MVVYFSPKLGFGGSQYLEELGPDVRCDNMNLLRWSQHMIELTSAQQTKCHVNINIR